MKRARKIHYRAAVLPEVHGLDLEALRAAGAPALTAEQGEEIRGVLNRLLTDAHVAELAVPVPGVRRRLDRIQKLAAELAELACTTDPASEAARRYVPALEELPLHEIAADARQALLPCSMKGAPNTTGPLKTAVSDLLHIYRAAGGTGKAYRVRDSEQGDITGPFLQFVRAAVDQAQAVASVPLYWSAQSLAEIVLKTPEP